MTEYFRNFVFTSNATQFICPEWPGPEANWFCVPPNACARGSDRVSWYCCNPMNVCWAIAGACAGDGSTFECSSGGHTWCCLKDKEICRQVGINACYSTVNNPLNNINSTVLNQTYSSLSSAQPSASFYTFDPYVIITRSQSSSTTATSVRTPSNGSHSSNTLSGGEIAGIVIGVLAAIAIAFGAGFFCFRHGQKKQNVQAQAAMFPADPRWTLPADEIQADIIQVAEMPVSEQWDSPRELPASHNTPTQSPGYEEQHPS